MASLSNNVQASYKGFNPVHSCSGYIIITGKTNINSFQLSQPAQIISPFLLTSISGGSSSFDQRPLIEIPVKLFKADNPFIYKDFLLLVNASEYPNIMVRIPKEDELFEDMDNKIFDIDITISGITRVYSVLCYTERCELGTIFLHGTKKLHLSDFNIVPPQKSFGLIKVKDEVIINFGFNYSVN
jgi:hypothetical protein